MSNRPRSSDPERDRPDPASDVPVAALDEAFAARLAGATPRLGIDASALHYEAGYREAVDGFRRERALYRGVACGSAALMLLSLGHWAWQLNRAGDEARPSVAPIVATTDGEPSAPAVSPDAATPNGGTRHDRNGETNARSIVAADSADLPAESARPRSSAAFAELDRRYLGFALSEQGRALRWTDLYDLSTDGRTTDGATWTSTPAAPAPSEAPSSGEAPSYRPAPWSVRPGEYRMNHLLREGI